jgi:hypothetical protein
MGALKATTPRIEPSRDLDVIYDRDDQPVTVALSIELWKELSPDLCETLPASFLKRDGEPRDAYIPWDAYLRIREEIEDAIDRLAFDRADTEYASERLYEKVEGIARAVPLEVVKAIQEGAVPIAAWRKFRGMRQNELAAHSGVERSYISHLEAASRQGTPEVLMRIANVLGCLIEDLIPPTPAR